MAQGDNDRRRETELKRKLEEIEQRACDLDRKRTENISVMAWVSRTDFSNHDCSRLDKSIDAIERPHKTTSKWLWLFVEASLLLCLQPISLLAWSSRTSSSSCGSFHSSSLCPDTCYKCLSTMLWERTKDSFLVLQAPETKEELIRKLQVQRAADEATAAATAKTKLEEQRLAVRVTRARWIDVFLR